MDCLKRADAVIEYVEDRLAKEIDGERIARIAGCPLELYQRIFAYISGMTLAQYVRRRRLAEAARDLMAGGAKVVDLAFKYGYESHGAFTRAFREQHGVPPSAVGASGVTLDLFARLSFASTPDGAQPPPGNGTSYRVVSGRKVMAELERITYADFGPRKLVGMERGSSFAEAGALWREYFEEGWSDKVGTLSEHFCADIDDYIALGQVSRFDPSGTRFRYLIGKYVDMESPIPPGLSSVDVPPGTIALARVRGSLSDIIAHAYFLITEAIMKNGYRVQGEGFYWCEVYTMERYCIPAERGEKLLTLDYFMPCLKAD